VDANPAANKQAKLGPEAEPIIKELEKEPKGDRKKVTKSGISGN